MTPPETDETFAARPGCIRNDSLPRRNLRDTTAFQTGLAAVLSAADATTAKESP
jgi:hypothetical protein